MNKRLSSVVLAGALLLPGFALQLHAGAVHRSALAQKPEHTAQTPVVPENERGDQTLRDAIRELEAIKSRVHAAPRQYGGHRGRADQYMEQAIQELRAALKFDQEHEKK